VLRTPDGAEREVLWSAAPVHGPERALLGAVAVGRDVTRQRLLEEQNRAALEVALRVASLVTEPGVKVGPLLTRLAEALCALAAGDTTEALLVGPSGRLTPQAIFGVPSEVQARWQEAVRNFDPETSPRTKELVARFSAGRTLRQYFDTEAPIVTSEVVST